MHHIFCITFPARKHAGSSFSFWGGYPNEKKPACVIEGWRPVRKISIPAGIKGSRLKEKQSAWF